uniref:Uncharacterized protein n=1 Tax=Arion vulgaris TaxID=1028688 RepID=A0A0B6ZCI8_9EUPU
MAPTEVGIYIKTELEIMMKSYILKDKGGMRWSKKDEGQQTRADQETQLVATCFLLVWGCWPHVDPLNPLLQHASRGDSGPILCYPRNQTGVPSPQKPHK